MSARLALAVAAIASLTACGDGGPDAKAGAGAPPAELVSGTKAVETAYIPSVDLASMTDAEIARVLPGGQRCAFRYTAESDPVFAADGGRAVGKINGDLVALSPVGAGGFEAVVAGASFQADGVRVTVQPLPDKGVTQEGDGRQWEANLRFEVASGPGLSVDYRGFYRCTA